MKRIHFTALIFLALVTVQAQDFSRASSATSRIHPQLSKLKQDEQVDVMVLHRADAPEGAGERIQSRTGLNLHHHFENVGQSAARLTRSEIERLANDPEVEFIAPDSPVKAFAVDKGPESIGAYAAYAAGETGNGVGVAVIDSGITYTNCDYVSPQCTGNSRLPAQMSFVSNLSGTWIAPNDGEDYFGHGSHVASIIAGSGAFSSSYIDSWGITPTYWIHGVAPGVNMISLRVLDSTGSGTDSMVIAAINWAITNQSALNIRVINLSLGRPFTVSYKQDPLCQAAEKAWKAGIVVVAAAGNYGRSSPATNGYGTITAPGNDPLVITVGAVNTRGTVTIDDDVVTSYSSKGPTAIDHIAKPDIVAPGNKIYATQCQSCPLVANYPANKVADTDYASVPPSWGTASNWYFMLSGTSMATPMVSGAAAILIAQDPSLTPDQVKARLMKTASKSNFVPSYVATDPTTGATYPINHDLFTIGAGELNITAALANHDLASGSAASPAVTFNAAKNQTQLVTGSSVLWGSSVVWGTSVVWSTSEVSGTSVVWSTSVVWATSTVSGSSVVWGTNAIVSGTGSALASDTSTAVLHGDE